MYSEDLLQSTGTSFLGQVNMNHSSSTATTVSTNGQYSKKNLNGNSNNLAPSNGTYQNQNINHKGATEKENIKYADGEPVKTNFQKPQFYEDEVWIAKQQQQMALLQQQQQLNYQKNMDFQVAHQQEPHQQYQYYEDEFQKVAGNNHNIENQKAPVQEPPQQKEPTLEDIMNQVDMEHDSEDEGIQDYKIGGYHPVHIGEVVNKRYVVIQKIGWGHFSTVWLAKDFKYDTYVALKIQKSAPHYLEAAFDEVEILQKVARMSKDPEWMKSLQKYYEGEKRKSFNKDDCQVVQLLNSFVFKGPYGNHFCFVFEILGVNLLEVIKRYNYSGVPMHLCRKIAKQVLIGLDFLHRFCDVIHTDLKPENVLLQLTQDELKDIIENGQMTKNQLFKERLKVIRKHLGVKEEEEKPVEEKKPQQQQQAKPDQKTKKQQEDDDNDNDDEDGEDDDGNQKDEGDNTNLKELEQKLKQPGLTKKQKKNLRKKISMKKRKLQEQKNAQQQPQEQQSTKESTKQENQAEENKPSQQKEMNTKDLFSQPDTKLLDKNKLMRGPQLDENFKLKIADLGNACWTFHHFATEIQTRQYRSPEVIIGSKYNTTADIWSLACMLFEMLTGDFLFEPRKGPTFSKNDDHLAQIEELCKKFPKSFAKRGEKSKKYFDNNGNLRRIPQLQYWPLKSVLVEKYRLKEKEAKAFEDFMMPMLHCMPEKRATAEQMLNHPWLKGPTTSYEFKQTEQEYQDYIKRKQKLIDIAKLQGEEYVDPNQENNELYDDDIYDGDGEVSSLEEFENDDEFYGYKPDINIKLVDRSFTNLGYIGYGDGIDLEALDNGGNWQFNNV
ncbi:Serine/Threonine kinase (macronuclear) [Tetrahymena thermophila SB210]|uniref:non-specific serine/threonine protein kinase n=1 Tax=Tetrahymena thermophila (strain SB210) TaxID=312017 RepID=I7MHN4_TETTS|nr:Serine/Threonine kinase [Tetrahymena thermophila SB210]EAS03134.2 Serine/Threonine kinase [Tetrahymena thermophila SB210]|eukprot:XP_001023379.2 Serine/Threonine kinase [Tetrahymena thermophila SB210]